MIFNRNYWKEIDLTDLKCRFLLHYSYLKSWRKLWSLKLLANFITKKSAMSDQLARKNLKYSEQRYSRIYNNCWFSETKSFLAIILMKETYSIKNFDLFFIVLLKMTCNFFGILFLQENFILFFVYYICMLSIIYVCCLLYMYICECWKAFLVFFIYYICMLSIIYICCLLYMYIYECWKAFLVRKL